MGLTLQHEAPQLRPSPPTPAPNVAPSNAPTQSATVASRLAQRKTQHLQTAKIVMPLRYAAWLSGDMGRALEGMLQKALEDFAGVRITYLPRAFLVEALEEPGPFLEAVYRAAVELEQGVTARYPVLHHEIGPVWTGTLQSVFA